MSTSNKPRFVKYLGERVKEWKPTEDGVAVFPREASFEILYIRSHRLGWSLDYKWELSAVSTVFDEKSMNDSRRELYRQLTRMECELSWKGIFSRKPEFKARERALKYLPPLTLDNTLADHLNLTEKVIEAIRKSGVHELYVNTYFEVHRTMGLTESIKEYYRNPPKIAWVASAFKGPGGEIREQSIINKIFDALDVLSSELREFTLKLEQASRE